MSTTKTVKVKFLRTVDHDGSYHPKGTTASIPAELAKEWAKGKKPAVEILKA